MVHSLKCSNISGSAHGTGKAQQGRAVHSECSKILNTFLFVLSNKMLVIRTGTHKMLLVRKANREDPD